MFYLNDIDEIFTKICIYEVTKDTCEYSLFENTPEALAFLGSLGLSRGQQPPAYDENSPYIWVRSKDYIFSNTIRGGGSNTVRKINGIYCRASNDKRMATNIELTVKRKDT